MVPSTAAMALGQKFSKVTLSDPLACRSMLIIAYASRADKLDDDVDDANDKLRCAEIDIKTFNADKFCE